MQKQARSCISIHTPREGSDALLQSSTFIWSKFQSTLPARGATKGTDSNVDTIRFQSTLPARGATFTSSAIKTGDAISIHTPREGSDLLPLQHGLPPRHFNPHSPRGERPQIWGMFLFGRLFQSTLPARGATAVCIPVRSSNDISIHTPREGSDQRMIHGVQMLGYFNPHSPRGERHYDLIPHKPGTTISIHTPREGSDPCATNLAIILPISIHTPREGSDPLPSRHLKSLAQFQSTLPARGAT